MPERHAVDGPRWTRELSDNLKFHQVPPVTLGWKADALRKSFVGGRVGVRDGLRTTEISVSKRSRWDNRHGTELMFNDFHSTSLRDLFPWRFGVSDLFCGVGGGGDDDHKVSRSSSDLGADVFVFGGSAALNADPFEHFPHAVPASMKVANFWHIGHNALVREMIHHSLSSCALCFTLGAS